MRKRDIALAFIRREVEETGELTVFALRAAQEHRIGYGAMMAAARAGMQRRARHQTSVRREPRAPAPPSNDLAVSSNPTRDEAEEPAEIAAIRRDLRRHERMLADARANGASAEELQNVETLVANDHALIAAWERKLAAEEDATTNPVLIDLRKRIDELSFEECVLALITRPHAGPLHVPMKTPETLQHLRDAVFDFARRGDLTLPIKPGARGARRLPIVEIDGKRYFRDDRLREYRAVDNPHERRPL